MFGLRGLILFAGLAGGAAGAFADDVSEVKAKELAFNQAQNEGRFADMFGFMLTTRTVFPTSGARMITGWSEADVKRRTDGYAAGQRSTFVVEDLQVQVFGDTAIATFYRVGTEKAAGESVAKAARYRFTGVWLRTRNGWRLAHRHESGLAQ